MSFFRTPIDPEVQKELFRRIDGLNKGEPYTLNGKGVSDMLGPKSEALENEYFKSCWARVVTIDGGGKPYYLNSQLGEDGKKPITEPLNIKNGNYIRGRAGITSISSNFKEFFLKQSTISWMCPDPKEFEEIQNHFLKHGRYVLVEFGWSTRKNIQLEQISTENLLKFSDNLNQRTKDSRGNYAAICGVITNFTFNQKQDGSYEGTFEVSSMGRNILGQKIKTDGKIENLVNFINETLEKDEINDNPDTTLTETELTKAQIENFNKIRDNFVNFYGTMKALPNVIQKYVDNEFYGGLREKSLSKGISGQTNQTNGIDDIAIVSKYGAAYIPITSKENFKTPEGSEDNLTYCTWGWFEDFILNSFFSFSSKSTDSTQDKFRTQFFSTDAIFEKDDTKQENIIGNTSTICNSNKNLFSLGLQSIILPGKFKQFKADSTDPSGESGVLGTNKTAKALLREPILRDIIKHFNKYFPSFERKDKRGQIRNMVFEANYLMESFIGATNIDEALMRFWQKVSNDYGGFWRFSIVQDDITDGKIKIVDLNIGQTNDTNVSDKLSTRSEYINWSSDNKDSKDPGKIFRFPLYEKNSFIQDFSLETAYDSEMATMAVFGSNADMQATRGDMGQGYTELAIRALSLVQNPKSLGDATKLAQEQAKKYDDILDNISTPYLKNSKKGSGQGASSTILKVNDDRYNYFRNMKSRETGEITQIPARETTASDTIQQQDEFGIDFAQIPEIHNYVDKIEDDINKSNSFSTEEKDIRKGYFWFDLTDTITQIYSSYSGQMLNEFKRTMLYKLNKSADPEDDSNFRVVLPAVPLQLSLTIQGIGGIKIGDLFYVDYLPRMYRDYCHWMVVGVDHEISTTGWTTKLDSRMIVNIPKLIENDSKSSKPVFTKVEFKPFVIPAKKQLRDKIIEIQKHIRGDISRVVVDSTASGGELTNDGFYTTEIDKSATILTTANLEQLQSDKNLPDMTNEEALDYLLGLNNSTRDAEPQDL